jgi:hypothetical protein
MPGRRRTSGAGSAPTSCSHDGSGA